MAIFARFLNLEIMISKSIETLKKTGGKELYDYQSEGIERLFDRLNKHPENYNILYQLPTGGGKTVIFSEITRRYILNTGKKVLILTHRIELCRQTSGMLNDFGVINKVIDSKVKDLPDQGDFACFVAMVETLNNRLQDNKLEVGDIGLVIIDEAHYNSFRKLFKYFEKSVILGVTATPLSSNIKLPMKDNYNELLIGNSIPSLINKGYLAKATTYTYDVRLNSLKVGINGDYTVSSSEMLYTNFFMQEKLLYAYEEKSRNKKTLIFNNGINTSKHVKETFTRAGYKVMHLDNTNTEQERRDILHWFKTVPNAILTSVGILTTGFDEPTVDTIILNRATRSLTLYHQMIGRGSRVLPTKKDFTVIDLGNNAQRFGLWDNFVDWASIFHSPDFYYDSLVSDEELEKNLKYDLPEAIKEKFSNASSIEFDVKAEYEKIVTQHLRPKETLERSIDHHVKMCVESGEDWFDALQLAKLLDEDIRNRVRQYSHCICKSSASYLKWLEEEYMRKLQQKIREQF